jgi:hypothetical protein
MLLIEKAFGFQFNEENITTAVINMKTHTHANGSHLALGNVLAILSLGCSVLSIAFIIIGFFTYAILAGLYYSCIRTIDFVTPFFEICLSKHHHHHQ